MAHFRGTVQGSRGEVSRLGGKEYGLHVAANGWMCGVRVWAHYDEETGKDVFNVYRTGGSTYHGDSKLIATVTEGEEMLET